VTYWLVKDPETLPLEGMARSVRRIYRDPQRRPHLVRRALDTIRDELPNLDAKLTALNDAEWAARREMRVRMQDTLIQAELHRLGAAAQETQTAASEVSARAQRLSELILERHALQPLHPEVVAFAERLQNASLSVTRQ
jgi:hypothetical protein